MRKTTEIECPACNLTTLLLREPVYEGLKKTGETLKCAGCGHVFASEDEVPFSQSEDRPIFSSKDQSERVQVFAAGEADALCRHCTQYVVNPFMQWCALHKKEVEATDHCDRFERKKPTSESSPGTSERPLL